MAWMKIETNVSRHRKFMAAGPAASWLWVCGMAYCQEGLTDGFIPFQALSYLGVKSASGLASKLVKAGLWETCEGGWRIHDYLEHNRSAATVHGIREERRKNGSEGGKASAFARRSTDVKQSAEANASSNVLQQPSKQALNPDQIRSDTATETGHQSGQSSVRFASTPIIQKRDLNAAFEGPRVSVPMASHRKFLRLRNHPDAERELQAWYERVSEEWAHGAKSREPTGANMLTFWDARYDEEWPPAAAVRTNTKPRPTWATK